MVNSNIGTNEMNLFGLRRKPDRLYIVFGTPRKSFKEPRYITDPRHYNLTPFDKVAPDQLRDRIKAFTKRNDAIRFAYHCNLDTVIFAVYDRVDDRWVLNSDETGKIAADVD
jgi:hypothetical protein